MIVNMIICKNAHEWHYVTTTLSILRYFQIYPETLKHIVFAIYTHNIPYLPKG